MFVMTDQMLLLFLAFVVQLTPLICTALGSQADLHVSGACI